MKLHELSPAPGSAKDSFRRGRGPGSGNGKTAGKGHKGQRAVSSLCTEDFLREVSKTDSLSTTLS